MLNKILLFLEKIEVSYHLESIKGDTFLPGLKLRDGSLVIDTDQLLYPGDVLHEAGHLACMPPEIRRDMSDNLEDCDLHRGGEMMAVAWSYAACVHLEMDPKIVFHQYGYKDAGDDLIQNFKDGQVIGLPLLQWSGMTYDQINAAKNDEKPFPHMISWTCLHRPC